MKIKYEYWKSSNGIGCAIVYTKPGEECGICCLGIGHEEPNKEQIEMWIGDPDQFPLNGTLDQRAMTMMCDFTTTRIEYFKQLKKECL